jgi:hypothetical protein
MLGDLIDLAQDNSVRWPVPQALPVARDGGVVAPSPRRHYLRVTGDAHPGLERRVESLVRHVGLSVQNRAHRSEDPLVHLGFMISPSAEGPVAEAQAAIARLARVQQCLCLGVLE